MKRGIILLMFIFFAGRPLYAFSFSASTNHVKVSQTATVTVGDISGSPDDYQWSSDIGSITGGGASVTFNAPANKGKATISVTVKNGATTLSSGTVQILVYKSIIVIKTDDYAYCNWNGPTYIRPNYKSYIDYMVNTAHVKTSVGLEAFSLESGTDVDDGFKNATLAYINSGYVEIYSHSYDHTCQATKNLTTITAEIQNSENLAWTKLGIHLRGFGPPGACTPNVSANTVTALNNAPEMTYVYSLNASADILSPNIFHFTDANHRLDCEAGGGSFDISYSQFQSQYAAKKDRDVNFVQIHPVWWDTDIDWDVNSPGPAMLAWQQILAYMNTEGVTVIFPYDYIRMLNEPAFVPDEGPDGSTPTDTTPPGAPAAVRDGISETDDPYTYSTTQLSANWDSVTDPDGPITKYQYAIGTSAGATNTTTWTDNSTTVVTKTGTYTVGQTYYFSVRAVSAGGTGTARNSNGILVQVPVGGDTTPPSAPAAVRDGTGSDVGSTSLTTQLSANWAAATDAESAISSYQYAIGTAQGATNITNAWLSNSTNLTVTKTGLALTVGATYYFSVRAVSEGGTGTATNSNGQYVTLVTPGDIATYPNPYSLSRPGGMKFTANTGDPQQVQIYTMGGKLMKTLPSTGSNTINWDGTNQDGEKVSRGIYIYIIMQGNGDKVTGKLALK